VTKDPDLKLILERIGPGNSPDAFRFWACRGARKGCPKKLKKQRKCPDCVPCDDEQETLGHLVDRLNRGDA